MQPVPSQPRAFEEAFEFKVFGKLFGGTFGFMMGGPVGALLGAAVGHNFDQAQSQGKRATAPPERGNTQEHIQDTFHSTAFQLMGHIAKADGRVSDREIATARAIMDRLRLNAGQRQAAINDFTAGKQPDFDLDAMLKAFQRACRGRPAFLQPLLELLLNVAYADDDLHPHTHARLLYITDRLGVHRLQFEALHALFRAQRWAQRQNQDGGGKTHDHRQTHDRRPTTAVGSLTQAYAVLGLQREASPDAIKLAYRRLLKQHHPDKLAGRNASLAELARATEKTRELTAAYDRIREARGF